jgi:predicted nucleic acid-binding protein
MRLVCVDACFLIGLYDERDEHHTKAKDCFIRFFDIGNNHMAVPWPILYETVSTQLVKDRSRMLRLESDWKKLSVRNRLELISDLPYRERVIEDCFRELGKPPGRYWRLSAADRVIRNILADRSVRISAFLTFNRGDFADVCKRVGTQLVY